MMTNLLKTLETGGSWRNLVCVNIYIYIYTRFRQLTPVSRVSGILLYICNCSWRGDCLNEWPGPACNSVPTVCGKYDKCVLVQNSERRLYGIN